MLVAVGSIPMTDTFRFLLLFNHTHTHTHIYVWFYSIRHTVKITHASFHGPLLLFSNKETLSGSSFLTILNQSLINAISSLGYELVETYLVC